MQLYQKITFWAMVIFAVATFFYVLLDYTMHPELKGNLTNVSFGVATLGFQFFFCWSYHKDAHRSNEKDPELETLRKEFEELKKEMGEKVASLFSFARLLGTFQGISRQLQKIYGLFLST